MATGGALRFDHDPAPTLQLASEHLGGNSLQCGGPCGLAFFGGPCTWSRRCARARRCWFGQRYRDVDRGARPFVGLCFVGMRRESSDEFFTFAHGEFAARLTLGEAEGMAGIAEVVETRCNYKVDELLHKTGTRRRSRLLPECHTAHILPCASDKLALLGSSVGFQRWASASRTVRSRSMERAASAALMLRVAMPATPIPARGLHRSHTRPIDGPPMTVVPRVRTV